MTTILRTGALACALLTTTCLTAPALAQTNQSTQPALRSVDSNGVDLISGTYPFTIVEGTIGSGDTGLSVVRTGMNNYGTSAWQNMFAHQTVSGSVKTVVITLGDSSETFTSTSGAAFVAALANGATLTGGAHSDFTYTDAGGTVMTFGAPVDDQYGASPFCAHAGSNLNDCFALPTSIVRPDQATTSLTWDVHANCATQFNQDGSLDCQYGWRLGEVANSFGYTLDFTYVSNSVSLHSNPSGDWFKRSGATLANGATNASISYNYVSSTVTEVTDTGGRVWRITTGTNSLGLRRPGSSSDDISVTTSGGQVTQVVRDGITTTYSRSTSGSDVTTTITDAASNVTSVVVDASIGRVTSVTDPLSHTTGYTYDGDGRLTRMTMSEGDYVNYTYDSRGNVTETRAVAKSGSGLSDVVATASYDSSCSNVVTCNQPNSTTDANGYTTNYTYDSTHGGVLTVTLPAPSGSGDRPETRYSYSVSDGEYRLTGISSCASGTAGGSPSCVGTLDESRTVIGYDSNGNPNSIEQRSGNTSGTGALSATTTATYDGYGNLLTVDGPLSGSTDTVRYRYNDARQVIGVTGPDPDSGGSLHNRAIRTTYGSDGLPTAVERGTVNSQSDGDWASFSTLEEVDTEYDSHHRPVVQRLASGGTTYQLAQTSYDSLGRPNCTAQRMNPSEFATASLPSDACTLDTTGGYGADRITRTSFDAAGRANLVQTGYGVSGVEANEVATTFTSNGQVATVTDAEGNMTTYEYDGHDRLLNIRMPSPTTDGVSAPTSGTGHDYEQFGYDDAGNTTSVLLRDGTSIGYTYDHLSRLTAKNLPGSELDVSYTYDLMNRMTSAATSAQTLTFGYDALSRNTSQAGPRGTVSYGYDLAGRRTSMTYPGSPTLVVGYGYDDADDLTTITENPAGSAYTLATFAYDDRGGRTSLTRGSGAVTSYAYDNVSRLTQIAHDLSGSGYDLTLDTSYDPAGGIASTTSSNDAYAWGGHYAIDRGYTANGLNQYTAAGSVTPTYDSRGNLTSAGSTTYSYSSENQLVGASGGVTLTYDPLGRLYETVGAATARMAYDGAEAIAEYNGSNSLQRRTVFGPGVDEPIAYYQTSLQGTTRRFFQADQRGSIVAISDSGGGMVNIDSYDEYGIPASSNAGRFQYTGQQWLADLGMYYYRARIYSPTLGRFLQTDPIGYEGGMNIYAYTGNDPVNFVDPSGLLYGPCTGSRVCPASQNGGYGGSYPLSGGLCASCSGFGSEGAAAFLGLNSGGSGGVIYVPGIPGSATGTPGTGPNQFITVTAGTPGYFYFAGGFGGPFASFGRFHLASQEAQGDDLHFRIHDFAFCSADELFAEFRKPGHSAPGAPYARSGTTPNVILTGHNPITQIVDVGARTITNVTQIGHRYHPGTVEIRVTPTWYGSSVSIVGRGTGAHLIENRLLGSVAFTGLSNRATFACTFGAD